MEIQNVGHRAPSPDPNDQRAVDVLCGADITIRDMGQRVRSMHMDIAQ
jgi:hypothetical protein